MTMDMKRAVLECCICGPCCPNVSNTLQLTINALYETGVIIMHQVVGDGENRIWQSHDPPGDEGYTSITDCDTITGDENVVTVEPANRYGVATCVVAPEGIQVVVYFGNAPGGQILFSGFFAGCGLGTLCHDDPEVTVFEFGGSCIDYHGVPRSGCVSLQGLPDG